MDSVYMTMGPQLPKSTDENMEDLYVSIRPTCPKSDDVNTESLYVSVRPACPKTDLQASSPSSEELSTSASVEEEAMSPTKPGPPKETHSKKKDRSSVNLSGTTKSVAHLPADEEIRGVACLQKIVCILKVSKIDVLGVPHHDLIVSLPLTGMSNAVDMASCPRNKCLFILDSADTSIVHKVGSTLPEHVRSKTKVMRIEPWTGQESRWPVGDAAQRLSVTASATVLVTCLFSRELKEFADDGKHIRTIRLHQDLASPLHAVLTIGGELVICYSVPDEGVSRVCLTEAADDSTPRLTMEDYQRRLTIPYHVTVHATTGLIFVADWGSRRVVVLDSTLRVVHEITTNNPDATALRPTHVSLDESRGRLYVAFNDFDRSKQNIVEVFSIR